jgi:hypothetical protein
LIKKYGMSRDVFMRVHLLALAILASCSPPNEPGAAAGATRATPVSQARGGDGVPTARHTVGDIEVTVDEAGVLAVRTHGIVHVLDRGVVPEIALAPGRDLLAYPRRMEAGTELVVHDLVTGQARVVSGSARVADRPAFAPDGRTLVFWGSDATERFAGMYTVDARAPGATPVRRSNVGVQSVDDPRFVEPPLDHASIRVDASGRVRYAAPAGEVVLNLHGGAP